MSQYGNLDHIVDIETLFGWRLSKIDFSDITTDSITYSWGDHSELINWIHHKDDNNKFGGNFFSINGSDKVNVSQKRKYPLVWLTTPVQGTNINNRNFMFPNVEIIVCSNTSEEWLNSTRWTKYIPELQAIANQIVGSLGGGVQVFKDKTGPLKYGFRTVPKYSIKEGGGKDDRSKAIDIWDAVVINADLIANNDCRDQEYFDFCNN